jgi:hypothetical protein
MNAKMESFLKKILGLGKESYHKLELWQLALIFAIILIIFCGASWSISLKAKQKKQASLQHELKIVLQNMQTVSNELTFLSTLTKESLGEKLQKQQLMEAYAEGKINVLFKKLVSSLSAYNLDLINLKNTPGPKLENNFYPASAEFVLQGAYTSLGEYLLFLKSLPVIYKYTKVEMIPKDANGSLLELKLSLELYYL